MHRVILGLIYAAGVILSVLKMGRQRSLRSKAAHFVSDLTTVLLNPISDKPSSKPSPPSQSPVSLPSLSGFLEAFLFLLWAFLF